MSCPQPLPGKVLPFYRKRMRNRIRLFFLCFGVLALLIVYSLAAGRYDLSVSNILSAL